MQFHVVCLTPNSRNADIIDYEISLWILFKGKGPLLVLDLSIGAVEIIAIANGRYLSIYGGMPPPHKYNDDTVDYKKLL